MWQGDNELWDGDHRVIYRQQETSFTRRDKSILSNEPHHNTNMRRPNMEQTQKYSDVVLFALQVLWIWMPSPMRLNARLWRASSVTLGKHLVSFSR